MYIYNLFAYLIAEDLRPTLMFHFYKRTIMMYLHVRTCTHVYVIEIGKGISVGANKAKEYE